MPKPQIRITLWRRKDRAHRYTSKASRQNILSRCWQILPSFGYSGARCQQFTAKSLKRRNLLPIGLLAVVSLTLAAGYSFYNQPLLKQGAIATETIRAPRTEAIVDTVATEAQRQAKQRGLVPVLTIEGTLTVEATQSLESYIDKIDDLREIAGKFPFTSTGNLSTGTQVYLTQANAITWREILGVYRGTLSEISANAAYRKAVSELANYRSSRSPSEAANLIKLIELRRDRYRQALEQIYPPILTSVLDVSDSDWEVTKMSLKQTNQRILAQGIPPGLPAAILENAIGLHLNPVLSPTAREITANLLLSTLQPNLARDPIATQKQVEQAMNGVAPIVIPVKEGEKIVSLGQFISRDEFIVLEHFGLSRRSVNWLGLLGFTAIITGAIGIFISIERLLYRSDRSQLLRQKDCSLILLLTLTTPFLSYFGVYYTNLVALGWLIGSFYHPILATVVVSLLTGLTLGTVQVGGDYILASAVAGIVAAQWAGKMRSREELAFLGAGVLVTQGSVYLLLSLIGSGGGASITYLFLDALRCSAPALGWSIFALGISPYLEHLFDLITPIRLVELANPNRPLLKRLASETPGTFQHTIFVANLAEAAARELGLNVELVRTGTLYHDIGKMHDPMGFIENQMGGVNKHDEINNPWESAKIIKMHVTEGLAMARRYRLPKAIQAFIPEHQGTIRIAYFHHQARQLATENPSIIINEADFRYPGPIPQSKETGIVMLADACEAALRSLKDVSSEVALMTVKKILHARWQEGELRDSGLRQADLPKIARTFLEVWRQSNHQRIVYPPTIKGNG